MVYDLHKSIFSRRGSVIIILASVSVYVHCHAYIPAVAFCSQGEASNVHVGLAIIFAYSAIL